MPKIRATVSDKLMALLDEQVSDQMLVDAIVAMLSSGDARMQARGVEMTTRLREAHSQSLLERSKVETAADKDKPKGVLLNLRSVLTRHATEMDLDHRTEAEATAGQKPATDRYGAAVRQRRKQA